jgi:hypothetical protein
MDLGVFRDTIEFLLCLKVDKTVDDSAPRKKGRPKKSAKVAATKRKYLNKNTTNVFSVKWNPRIDVWAKLTPKEFGRKMSNLDYFIIWKANNYHQFFMYYMIPLMRLDLANFDHRKREAVLNMILGYKLVSGNSNKPIADALIDRSKQLLSRAFSQMTLLSNGSWCTYKCHCMTHFPDDARHFECHVGALSAYPYESQMNRFRQMGLQGTNVIQQIANRLMEKGHLEDFQSANGNHCDDESFETFFAKVMRNSTSSELSVTELLDFPPFFVHDFKERTKKGKTDKKKEENNRTQTVRCEDFTITNCFPNNVVRLHFDGKTKRRRNAFVIDKISRDGVGELTINVREFQQLTNTFEKPYPSSVLGNFVASGGLLSRQQTFPFSRIIGKYFSFPTLLTVTDEFGKYDPSHKGQAWILQEISHSEI